MTTYANDYATVLDKNGTLAFVPHGISMWPFFKNGKQTVIIVKKTARLNPLDVAFYVRGDGTVVMHRVVEVLPDGYVMRGDSHFVCEKVLEDNVIGVLDSFYVGKKLVKADDPKYNKRVKRWYKNGKITTFRKKLFHYMQAKNIKR